MMNNQQLLIIGAGGHAKVVADCAQLMQQFSAIALLDDRYPDHTQLLEFPIIGPISELTQLSAHYSHVAVALGDNRKRVQLLQECQKLGFKLPILVHPSAVVSPYAQIEAGTVVFATAVVHAEAKVGFGNIINTGAVVEHDVCLGEGVHLAPQVGLAGGASVGDLSWIGIGASVLGSVQIGCEVTVGAGSVVTQDIPDKATVVGVPAKAINYD